MYLVIGIALMVVALIGIIWCQKKQFSGIRAFSAGKTKK